MNSYAAVVIARFQGVRPLARLLSVSPTTVYYWKRIGTIPRWRHDAILAAAEGLSIYLDDIRELRSLEMAERIRNEFALHVRAS